MSIVDLLAKKKTRKGSDSWDPNVPLTAEDGPLDRGQSLREIAAYYADGKLIVSKSHRTSPLILSLIEEARIAGYPAPSIEAVDIHRVQICYERMTGALDFRSKHDDVRMRREVLSLIEEMSKRRVSDIHVVVYEASCLVRARVAGSMEHIAEWPPEYGHSFCAAAFTMADAADVNYQPYEYQAARVSNRKDLQLPEGVISLRLQFNPTVYEGRAMIMRLLYNTDDKTAGDVAGLGFTPVQLEDFEFLRSKPYGINVVAGPTGHGKSTTLQRNIIAILKEYNYNLAFYTVEDPPEYPIQGAVQMPVTNASTQAERSAQFTKAIAAALRSNPDRLMIGEVRDEASAQLAFEAAMTGHQVWTSLHSNDALTIPFRLRDLHVEDYKLCDPTLFTGMISQRLVRKLCKTCAIPLDDNEMNYNMLARFEAAEITYERLRKRNPQGCDKCNYTGYVSRTVVAEVIVPDTHFMELVKKDQKTEAERYWLSHLNGRNMIEHMVDRLRAGEVDPQDAERVVGPIILPKREG